ncbi:MAG: hypothetical protein PHF79_01135 [Candidatus Pacebacteria bacterium]|nr:hypothetical protein [Candidatus Paceibacterota bacterium]
MKNNLSWIVLLVLGVILWIFDAIVGGVFGNMFNILALILTIFGVIDFFRAAFRGFKPEEKIEVKPEIKVRKPKAKNYYLLPALLLVCILVLIILWSVITQ